MPIHQETDPESLREDFDRLALLSSEEWDHNRHYNARLLALVPEGCDHALDIGCGTGAFSRLLAVRSRNVTAVDLSPEMIRIARGRSTGFPNIDFLLADALTWRFPEEHFDCVVSIAALHHLPLEAMLLKMRAALKPSGILLVLDLFQAERIADHLAGAASMPLSIALRWAKLGRVREPRDVREAWAGHGSRDSYVTLTQARTACRMVLPGARVRRHLLWRFSIVWRKETEMVSAEAGAPAGMQTADALS